MTSPAVDTGIVAFIEARLDEREAAARGVLDDPPGLWAEELARWLLAEVAKDRAILALHATDEAEGDPYCIECGDGYPCQTVRLLAAIDADHPAYRPEWKPVAG